MPTRVFITGTGVVSPVGVSPDAAWKAVQAGQSGAGPITRFDTEGFKTTFACEASDFDPLQFMDRKEVRRMDLFAQFAMASAVQAAEQAKLESTDFDRDRAGVVYGSGMGGMQFYEDTIGKLNEGGPSRVSPFFIPIIIGDIAPGHISMRYGLKGVNYGTQSACATSTHALGLAMMHIRAGDADLVLTGGSEAPITRAGVAGFNTMHALSTRNDAPQKASRPFEKDRDGFVMGEGGASFVIESEQSMKRRGVEPIAEVLAYGFSGDAHHLTAPPPGHEGAVRSMRAALRQAGLEPEQVDYLNAHGTSTQLNDKNEAEAVRTVFGDKPPLVSSTKSMTGHLLGAAGAVEAFICAMALRDGIVPPTINFDTPDPEIDLDVVPNEARKADLTIAMSNTFGFGGHNATIVLRKV